MYTSIKNKILNTIETNVVDNSIILFDAKVEPNITIIDYIDRIYIYGQATETIFIISIILIDRLPNMKICHKNAHRLILIAVLIATKIHSDAVYTNTYYAILGGIDIHELNDLELFFLDSIKWEISITMDDFRAALKKNEFCIT